VAPFNDKRVRQALNYAVDKNAIDKALYSDLAVPLTSPLPEAQWGFDKSLKGYPYDPAKAKQLLEQAGVKDLKVEFLAYNSPRGYNPAGPALAVAVQGALQKVGIQADVRQLEMGSFLSTVRSGKYQGIFLAGWSGDNGDPDNFLGELWGAKNIPIMNTSHYNNPEVEKLLAQALQVSDVAKRTALYGQVQKLILDDAPWIFVNSTLQVRAISKKVHDYQLNPTQMFFDMEKVSLQ
jgi:peptide/nickel transport system substrate-binding protein